MVLHSATSLIVLSAGSGIGSLSCTGHREHASTFGHSFTRDRERIGLMTLSRKRVCHLEVVGVSALAHHLHDRVLGVGEAVVPPQALHEVRADHLHYT